MKPTPPLFESAFRLTVAPDWWLPTHRHEGLAEYILPETGAMISRQKGTEHIVQAGEISYTPPSTEHERIAQGESKPVRFITVRFHASSGQLPTECAHLSDPDGRLYELAQWMMEHHPATSETEEALLQALGAAFIAEHHYELAKPSASISQRATQYMRRHLDEALRVDAVAAHVNLSKHHFIKIFKAETGTTPMAALRRMRVNTARSLIEDGMFTLDAIARSVGFNDGSHLGKICKKISGKTPGQLRKASLKE